MKRQKPKISTGLERLVQGEISNYEDLRLGIICNPTSVNHELKHAIELLLDIDTCRLTAIYGPQHGIFGETQDNMVEWESFRDPRTGLPIYSLYGETRIPTPEMLTEVDALLFDMQDVGSRYYTFIYTMAHAMIACRRNQRKIIVLDRPNPITGLHLEGNLLKERYASFVGMYPILIRHGMTVGELALMFNDEFEIDCDLEVIPITGWRRDMWYDETGLPWVIPSPNMPTLDTAVVYPGMCLLEGSILSEGRGTTKPFELFGAPFIDPVTLTDELNAVNLPGVHFRPTRFRPTFQKWKGIVCGGAQIHVLDRNTYQSVNTALAVLHTVRRLYPDQFRWRLPPYEYEYEKLPIDILAGCSSLRRHIDSQNELERITTKWKEDTKAFAQQRSSYLLYD